MSRRMEATQQPPKRTKGTRPLLLIAGLVVVGLCLCLLLGARWVFLRATDMDINSGVLRHQVRVLTLPVAEEQEDSPLSREVRRLGIVTAETPLWKRTSESRLWRGIHVCYIYGGVLARATELVMSLELSKTPDDERREVLQRFMLALQSADPQHAEQQARLITDEIAGRAPRPAQ
ncbi:hypothetical protein [Anaerobaca lacustris]|uniref:Uncharacterized protein n=1 Tax=Anaerobaca lacustris TaxID=3044600 RepID=A0AAW6TWJ7_9BACT|nr:hypothetical protein [Sedimentisphaerales bacterium M17dextr]